MSIDEQLDYGGTGTNISPEIQNKRDSVRVAMLEKELEGETDPSVVKALKTEISSTRKRLNGDVQDISGTPSVNVVDIPMKIQGGAAPAIAGDIQNLANIPGMQMDPETNGAGPTIVTGSKPKGLNATISGLAAKAEEQYGNIEKSYATMTDRVREMLDKQMSSVRKEGELAATMKLEEFRQASVKAGENAAQLSRLGINNSDMDSLIASISTELTSDYQEAKARRADIMEKKSVGLFDNPLQYIINQFTLPREIDAHNDIIRKIAANKEFVDQATQTAQSIQQVNAAKYTPITMAGAQAAANLEREKAEAKALAIGEKGLQLDYNQQVQLLTLTQGRIANLDAMSAAAERSNSRQDAEARKADELERKLADDTQVKTAGRVLGVDVMDRKQLDKLPKDLKSAVEYVMANGGGVGKDPMEAWEVLARGNYKNMPPAVAYQRNMFDNIKRQAEDNLRNGKDKEHLATMKPAQIKEAVSQEMQRIMNHAATDPNYSIKPATNGVVDNPYHRPSQDVMEKIPAARGLTISGILADHRKNFPTNPVTDNQVLELAYQMVGDGGRYKDITEAAKDVTAYFRAGVNYNNENMRFDQFGQQLQDSYKVGRTDTTNVAQVTKYFLDKKKAEFTHPDFGRFESAGKPFKTVGQKIDEAAPKEVK